MDDRYEISAESVDLSDWDAVIDVRPFPEISPGIPGSSPVALADLLDAPIRWVAEAKTLVVCDVGVRSRRAVEALHEAGATDARSLEGGIDAWRRLGRDLEGTSTLGPAQLDRYDRQMKLPEVGTAGQERISAATVAVVGAGGLGNPVLSYLAGAGVGTLRIIDDDAVAMSNLHRQPMFGTTSLGSPKAQAAAEEVRARNDLIDVQAIEERLDDHNAAGLLAGADVVVDATDTPAARHAINAACVALGIPLVTAAVYRWEGQLTTYVPGGPCYRCVFPSERMDGGELDCAIAGVAGPVVGVVGSMQAVEVLKLLTAAGGTAAGRLLIYEGTTGSMTTVNVERRDGCPVCSMV